MARFKLTIEYVGTRYSGWQIQKNARTVQGEIHAAVRAASGRSEFEVYGSGRTDAGVHALRQVAHLDLETRTPPETLQYALNDELPPDINVLKVERVSRQFHARHSARSRSYLYQVCRRRTAFGKPFVWWVKDPLDAARMARGAQAFLGMKDFRAFTAGDPEAASTKVLVDRLELKEDGDLILLRVQGSHFLWKMVRRMVGVLVEVGRRGMPPEAVARLMVDPEGSAAPLTAPPSGLFLERVFYDGDPLELPLRPAMSLGLGGR
jgi:tRNA pseudouridine38-40 synthase